MDQLNPRTPRAASRRSTACLGLLLVWACAVPLSADEPLTTPQPFATPQLSATPQLPAAPQLPADALPPAHAADTIELGASGLVLEMLPFGLLWEPPMANQREPRTYVKLTNLDGGPTYDTAVGAEFAMGRIGPEHQPQEGVQLVLLAAAFMRFDHDEDMVCADYRVGCPLTFAWNDWQGKLGYEHTSTHTSDLWISRWWTEGFYTGERPPLDKLTRDEVVLGLARRLYGQFRVYGQFGYSFATGAAAARDRYDWGLEWSPTPASGRRGAPVAAFDMDLRDEQGFCPNTTVQLGWQWRVDERRSSAARLVAEYYNGHSPFGLSRNHNEHWWALALSYDW